MPSLIAAELAHWQAHLGRFAALLGNPPDAAAACQPEASPGRCLIFAPHPDDECIVGALPLRLRQEAGWQVTNVAVTLGSNPARREPRWAELQAACAVLDFECIRVGQQGLTDVRPDTLEREPTVWAAHVAALAALLREHRPQLVLAPHVLDDNPSHRGVYQLVIDALSQAHADTVLACTEFWSTQSAPNLLVHTNLADTARLVTALARHVGEIERNPYHLRLPAFMADAVRRGGELLHGAGEAPPDFAFATLYRLIRFQAGQPLTELPRRIWPAARTLDASVLQP